MNGTATKYDVSHITAYSGNPGLVYNGTIIAGEGDQVQLNLSGSSDGYIVDYGTLTGTANPYTLAMAANNTTIAEILPLPPYSNSFEETCGWTLVNGNSPNAWAWGEAAHNDEGTHGLYISNDGGTTNTYDSNRNTMVYAYVSISAMTCPKPSNFTTSNVGATTALLSWIGGAEVDSYTVRYRTVAGISQPVFSENFENGLDDWTLRDCDANTGIFAYAAHFGQYGFRFRFNTTPPQYLISPELSEIAEGMRLKFYYRNSSSLSETFQIGFSSTDNATESFTFGDEITVSDGQWHLYNEPIPAGTKNICWKHTSYDKRFLYIDDIAVGTDVPAGEWLTTTTSTDNITLIDLISGTNYEAQVTSDCDEQPHWSERVTFTTLKQTTVTQTINLASGINWVSFYVETTLDDLKAALVSASNNASGIKITSQNNGYTNWNGSSWRGSLSPLDVSQMYVIEVPSACAISLEAMPINPAAHPITIVNGINWIGFPFSADMSLTDAFSGFAMNGDKVMSLNEGSANYQGSWNGDLSSLQPGKGYKLEVTTTAPRTLIFPTGAKKAKPFDLMGK